MRREKARALGCDWTKMRGETEKSTGLLSSGLRGTIQ